MTIDVTLRPIRAADWRAVHHRASRPEASRFQAWGPNTEEESRAFTADAAAAWSAVPLTRRVYAATVDGRVLGCGELRVDGAADARGEIRYIVHPDHWGRGIATAIGRGLLDIAFGEPRMHRVYGTCDPRNEGSAAVLRGLGMTREGLLRHTVRLRDGWRDPLVFGLLADEWAAKTPWSTWASTRHGAFVDGCGWPRMLGTHMLCASESLENPDFSRIHANGSIRAVAPHDRPDESTFVERGGCPRRCPDDENEMMCGRDAQAWHGAHDRNLGSDVHVRGND